MTVTDKRTHGSSTPKDKFPPISRRQVLRASGAGLASVGFAGCIGGGSGSSDTSGPFTIGANLALSEGWSPWGNTILNSGKLAAKEINESGGLGPNGREIEFVAEDNQVDPSTAREKANSLIESSNADILFGPISSATRVAISPVAAENEIPLLYPVQYEGQVADDYCNEWLFKTGGVPVQTVNPFVPWLVDNYGEKFYMLGSDYNWPNRINSVAKPVLEDAGGEVVGEEYVSLGTTDFSSIVERISQSDPDVLFMTLTGPSPTAIQSEMLNQGVRDQWAEVGLAHGQGSLAGADPASVEGVITCHNYAESMQNEQNQAMMASYYDEFGDDVLANYMTGPAYITIKLLEQAVEQAGDTSPSAIKEALPSTGLESSVVGAASFDEDHQLTNDAVAKQMNGNKLHEVIEKFDSVSPEAKCDSI